MKFKVYALLSNFTAFVPKYFLKYYRYTSKSSQYFMKIYNLFEYLLSEVYFKTSNVLRFIVLLTHICVGIREFLQMCQNNGIDSIQSVSIAQYLILMFVIIKFTFQCTCTCFRKIQLGRE